MTSECGSFIRNGCSDSRLKCLYMNARSIVNKKKELELTVRDEKLDIIAITESWLNVSIQMRKWELRDTHYLGKTEMIVLNVGGVG